MKRESKLKRKKRDKRTMRTQADIDNDVRRFLNPSGIDVDPEALAGAFRQPLIEMFESLHHHPDPHLDAIMRRKFDPDALAHLDDLFDAIVALSDPRQEPPHGALERVQGAIRFLQSLENVRRRQVDARVREQVRDEQRHGRSLRSIALNDFVDRNGEPLDVSEATLRRFLRSD
jgi:hypothetical protein